MEAGRCAVAWVEYQASTEQLASARRKLQDARRRYGQSWNPTAIQRLSKRAALNDSTYSAALARLEHMTAGTRHTAHDALVAQYNGKA